MPLIESKRVLVRIPKIMRATEKKRYRENTCILFGSSNKVVANVFLLKIVRCMRTHEWAFNDIVNARGSLLCSLAQFSLAFKTQHKMHICDTFEIVPLYMYSSICTNKAYPFMFRWVLCIININNLSFTHFACYFSIWNIAFDSWTSIFTWKFQKN